MFKKDNENFQTPKWVANYMASILLTNSPILEPTPGRGNLVEAAELLGYNVIVPKDDFFDMPKSHFAGILMNPPFSPATLGYKILDNCMEMSNNIIALMPWWTIINSEKRILKLLDFGMPTLTHLPRYAFPGARIQTCIIELRKGFRDKTRFGYFNGKN